MERGIFTLPERESLQWEKDFLKAGRCGCRSELLRPIGEEAWTHAVFLTEGGLGEAASAVQR